MQSSLVLDYIILYYFQYRKINNEGICENKEEKIDLKCLVQVKHKEQGNDS